MLLHDNKERKFFPLHRLIATLFCKNDQNKNIVNHIDGNRLNNHHSNLEWVSSRENTQHAAEIGKKRKVKRICPITKETITYDLVTDAYNQNKKIKVFEIIKISY